jgi:hypothetical protein
VKIDWDRTEGWKQTYYLEWDEGKTYATAQISFNDRDVAKRVYDRLQGLQRKTCPVGIAHRHEVFVQRTISPDEMDRLGKILGETNRGWIGLWRRIGGLSRSMR